VKIADLKTAIDETRPGLSGLSKNRQDKRRTRYSGKTETRVKHIQNQRRTLPLMTRIPAGSFQHFSTSFCVKHAGSGDGDENHQKV